MKSLFGQDHLSWKTEEQQGVFEGQGVYDAAAEGRAPSAPVEHATGGAAPATDEDAGMGDEIEYPLPGSVASCDACGDVVNRFYHCQDCPEETGLFDLCTECCVRARPPLSTRSLRLPPASP